MVCFPYLRTVKHTSVVGDTPKSCCVGAIKPLLPFSSENSSVVEKNPLMGRSDVAVVCTVALLTTAFGEFLFPLGPHGLG